MLSVCIPTYNTLVVALVHDLYEQCLQLNCPFEIIIADDFSTNHAIINENKKVLEHKKFVQCIYNSSNLGRRLTRNKLALQAQYPNLLFIDGDAKINNPNYIQNYCPYFNHGTVVVGGTMYQTTDLAQQNLLRYLVGKKTEEIQAHIRQHKPYNSFVTFNFLMPKVLFDELQIPNYLNGYGHEDTLIGIQLSQRNVPLAHIQNPLVHTGLDDNLDYMHKIEQSLQSALLLYYNYPHTNELCAHIKILRYYKMLSTFKLRRIVAYIFSKTKTILTLKLTGTKPQIQYLNYYKLGYLCYCPKPLLN